MGFFDNYFIGPDEEEPPIEDVSSVEYKPIEKIKPIGLLNTDGVMPSSSTEVYRGEQPTTWNKIEQKGSDILGGISKGFGKIKEGLVENGLNAVAPGLGTAVKEVAKLVPSVNVGDVLMGGMNMISEMLPDQNKERNRKVKRDMQRYQAVNDFSLLNQRNEGSSMLAQQGKTVKKYNYYYDHLNTYPVREVQQEKTHTPISYKPRDLSVYSDEVNPLEEFKTYYGIGDQLKIKEAEKRRISNDPLKSNSSFVNIGRPLREGHPIWKKQARAVSFQNKDVNQNIVTGLFNKILKQKPMRKYQMGGSPVGSEMTDEQAIDMVAQAPEGQMPSQEEQIAQIIEIFAEMQGVSPEDIVKRLQQMKPEEQQQAIQEMAMAVQSAMEQQESEQQPQLQAEQQMAQQDLAMAMWGNRYSH